MTPLVEHFDHFVVPVNDLVVAEQFYAEVFGAQPAFNAAGRPMRFGLTVAQHNAGQVPHTFFDIGGRRIGVYLQEQERPETEKPCGAPVYSFCATNKGFDHVLTALQKRAVEYELDETGSPDGKPSVDFNDPAGNNFRVFIRNDASAANNGDGDFDLMVSDLRIEAPDLDRSVGFYADVFGLVASGYGKDKRSGAREAALSLPSGQSLFLTEVPFSPKGIELKRTKPGPHLAFFVAPERWDALMGHLAAKGIPNGDRSTMFKGRTPDDRDTYLDEPSGHVIQLVSEAVSISKRD